MLKTEIAERLASLNAQVGALREEAEAIRREEERERTKTEDTRLVAGRLGVAKLVPENLDALTGPRGANSTAVWG